MSTRRLREARRRDVRRRPLPAVIPRRIIDRTTTPDGQPLELVHERGHYVLRVGKVVLMSSATRGSEIAMARAAAERLVRRPTPRVLVGGLGMGFTLRAALDAFGPAARITVAELLPQVLEYARGELGPLSNHAIDDPRVKTHVGDVRTPLAEGGWDAVLLDVDNGPSALTAASNAGLYGHAGCRMLASALTIGGVAVVWSGYEDAAFAGRLRYVGLECETVRVRARVAALRREPPERVPYRHVNPPDPPQRESGGGSGSGSESGRESGGGSGSGSGSGSGRESGSGSESGSGRRKEKGKGARHTLFVAVRGAC